MLQFRIFLLCSTVLNIVSCMNETVVTVNGLIRGKLQKTIWYNKPYYSYKGIPYAKSPVDELRFRAPEPVEPWFDRPLDAFEYGPLCAQRARRKTSEDCLFLNIFVPVVEATKNLPVLFYIHGGFFMSGVGDQGPDFWMENEVILVTVNYRLGIFGFMSLGTPEYSGNMALKDQQLALKWIYENIEAFGGDNQMITISGSSAGANCVGLHLINEESSKYFSQILSISGAPNKAHNYQKGDHRCLMEHFYNKHFNSYPNDIELIDFLKKADVKEIIDFLYETFKPFESPWSPVVEKPNAIRPIILDDPMTALEKTKNIEKTAYYTITQYEFLSSYLIGGTNYSDPEVVRQFIKDFNVVLPIFGYKSIIEQKPYYLQKIMNKLRNFYFKNSSSDQELLKQRLVLDSDFVYGYSIEKWMERHVAISKKDTFYHRFSLQTKLNMHSEYPGAGHEDERHFIFGRTNSSSSNTLIQIKENKDTDKDCAIAFNAMNVIQKLFSNFIKYGKPVHNGDLMAKEFKPIQRASKSDEFNYIDVTNDGLVAGKALSQGRTKYLDNIIEEVKRLIEKHGDVPKKTPIEIQCEKMNPGRMIPFSENAEQPKNGIFSEYTQKIIRSFKNSRFLNGCAN
ncbi:venom carboxylesterase-6-like [Contarinia nasturtii]|uniref:venom carboxylesterase-6-like n=1 Tax=Contarinia nasturtii TaxID=265458 RepID=UPI0012D3D4D5|nr:venom carboxylesterase-6-like [Contarinia nasturtii]